MSKRTVNASEEPKEEVVVVAPEAEEPKKAEPPKAPESDIEKLAKAVNALTGKVTVSMDGFEKKFGDFDERLKKLEAPQQPADGDTSGKTAGKSEAVATPPKKKAEPPKAEEAHGCTIAVNGVRKAFAYRDLKTKTVYVVADRWAAKQAGNGEYDEVWAFYKNGQIDHLLDNAEIREYFG